MNGYPEKQRWLSVQSAHLTYGIPQRKGNKVKPSNFEQSNACLKRPGSMTAEECESLNVLKVNGMQISLWKMSFIERIRALIFGRVWLYILSGPTHPPVALSVKHSIFKES